LADGFDWKSDNFYPPRCLGHHFFNNLLKICQKKNVLTAHRNCHTDI